MRRRCGRGAACARDFTAGIPKSVEPLNPTPTPEEIGAILTEAGLAAGSAPHTKCSWPVPVALVVQWWKATSPVYSARGAGQVCYKGPEGAVIQQGMTVLAHNGATLVRIRQQQFVETGNKVPPIAGLETIKRSIINDPKTSDHYLNGSL